MKKILFIATGGTVSCGSGAALTPTQTAQQLLAGVDAADADITAVQPFSLDSTDMSPREWCELARLIAGRYDEFDGFVVAHGTDTLGYAAAALSCLIANSKKPVALTGSMLPMGAQGSDAVRNLTDAFRFVCDERAHGVRVVFASAIIDGRCAVKVDTHAARAFESIGRPAGAVRIDGRVLLNEQPFSGETRFFDALDERAAVLRLYPGITAQAVRFSGIRALVIEGFGTGGLPAYSGLAQTLRDLHGQGVNLIMTTQVLHGGSDISRYEVGARLKEFGVIDAGLMTGEYALMRAMWALGASQGAEDFARVFADADFSR